MYKPSRQANPDIAMILVAIGWMFVVTLMAIAEATSQQGTLLGAIIAFVLYGVFPLSITLYLLGTPGRRRLRREQDQQAGSGMRPDPDGSDHASGDALAPERKEP